MRVITAAALAAFFVSPSAAREITVSDQDQQAISQICDIASLSATQSLQVRTAIGQWCLAWQKRVHEATQQITPPPAAPSGDK